MSIETDNYWTATKHPWACVLFVLPLLALYEIGLHANTAAAPEAFRNGADFWLRAALEFVGISPGLGAPCLLLTILLAWGLVRREGRPTDNVGVWVGMIGESAAYAVLLLGLCQAFWHVLLRADAMLGQPSQRIVLLTITVAEPESVWGHLVSYLGAGIYEETLFRLLLFSGLSRLFSWSETRVSIWPTALAAFASAFLFAAAHHIGPSGEVFNFYVFTFRAFAGVYFACLYLMRGFGIAVGAHAGYDMLVGLIVR